MDDPRSRGEQILRVFAAVAMIVYVACADRISCDYECQHGESFSKFFGATVYIAALVWLAFQWINARDGWLSRYWNGVRLSLMVMMLVPILSGAMEPWVSGLGLLWLVLLARARESDPRTGWIQAFRTMVFALTGIFTILGTGYWIQTLPARAVHNPSRLHASALWTAYRLRLVSLDELGFAHERARDGAQREQVAALYLHLTGEQICESQLVHACD